MRGFACLLLCGALAWAQTEEDVEEFAKLFEQIVEAGQLGAVLAEMPEDFLTGLGEEPSVLRRVAETCSKWALKHAADDAKSWNRMLEVIESGCADAGDSDDVRAARTEALLCRVRVRAVTGEDFVKKDWVTVAEYFIERHEADAKKGQNLERAARILEEGGRFGGDEAKDLTERGNQLCLDGAKQYRTNTYFANAKHRAQLATIETTLAQSRGKAKKMLQGYLASLEKEARRGGSMSVATAYNDTVTFAHTHKKLGVKPKYVTESATVGLVKIEFPRSNRWKKSGRTLYQYDDAGTLLRTFTFDSYKWTTNYYLGTKIYGGDNIKGLGRIGEADVLGVVKDVKHRVKLKRGRLSKAITSSQMFVIGGLDEKDRYLCYRWWYFKAKKTKLRSGKVAILETAPIRKLDPEAKFVLGSVRE